LQGGKETRVYTEGEEGDLSSDGDIYSEDEGNLTAPEGEEASANFFDPSDPQHQTDSQLHISIPVSIETTANPRDRAVCFSLMLVVG
jgi:hypothetical protein